MLFKLNSSIVISTSRKPSQITRRFAQFLKHYFNAVYITRGKSSFTKIVNQARQYDNSILLIITETKGNPSNINIYDLEDDSENPMMSIYINVSIAQENNKVNTNDKDIVFINKVKELDELFSSCSIVETKDKIRSNCIVIRNNKKELVCANFIDKNGDDTKFKVYIKGFKIKD